MRYEALSDIGNVRKVNEDFLGAELLDVSGRPTGIFVIADGMGGHNKGELASKIAVENTINLLKEKIKQGYSDDNPAFIIESIIKSYEDSNSKIIKMASSNEEYKGMGTTLTTAVILHNRLYIGNVGDSRCYIFRGNRLERLTNDNSLVQELVFKGLITEDEARVHPQRNLITRAVGLDKVLKVDIYEKEVAKGDQILLTTDGLTSMISSEDIQSVLTSSESITKNCTVLVEKAKTNGGSDNISVINILI